MMQVVAAALSMTMDMYRQIDSQDPDTGAIKKEWLFYKTLPCYAKAIISNSGTARSGDNQKISNIYQNSQYIELRTTEKLSIREKISNICANGGEVIWTELNYPNNTPTVFEVVGSAPLTDPFGNIIAWSSTLKRSENQQIGI